MDEAFADLETSMRSRTCTPAPDNFRFTNESARYNMESQPRSIIDFSLPTSAASVDNDEGGIELFCPLSWSSQNILAFPRGNRVYLKNVASTVEDVGYTFKPSKKHGILRMLDFCRDTPNLLALGTSNDNIELWDIEAKKMTRSWTATGITCLEWNEGRVLAVGDKKGSIQYYDTRIDDRKEMKMKKGKVTRHEAPITTISWNRKDPKYLASGDKDGVVYYWDSRQDAPLKMGEMVQRRRKMQHDHAVSVGDSASRLTLLLIRPLGYRLVQLARFGHSSKRSGKHQRSSCLDNGRLQREYRTSRVRRDNRRHPRVLVQRNRSHSWPGEGHISSK